MATPTSEPTSNMRVRNYRKRMRFFGLPGT
jgi:hypothetical protein